MTTHSKLPLLLGFGLLLTGCASMGQGTNMLLDGPTQDYNWRFVSCDGYGPNNAYTSGTCYRPFPADR